MSEPTLTYAGGPAGVKQQVFAETEQFTEMCALGSMGCIDGETRIYDYDEQAHIPVEELYARSKAPTVLAWSEEGFIPVKASVPFIKGKAPVYLIRLENGRHIKVTVEHKFLTTLGWRSAQQVFDDPSLELLLPPESLLPTSSEPYQLSLQPNARRLMRTIQGSQFDYLEHRRSYDERLRLCLDSGLGVPPSLDDVPQPHLSSSGSDGRERTRTYSPSYTEASHLSTDGSSARTLPQPCGPAQFRFVETTSSTLGVGKEGEAAQSFLGSTSLDGSFRSTVLGKDRTLNSSGAYHMPSPLGTSNTECTTSRVESVKYLGDRIYYDLHVPHLNNYVAEGFVNHNSGKSRAMCMAILFDVLNYPGCRIALMRSERTLLKQSTLETFFAVLNQAGLKEGKEGNSGDYYHFKNDSVIEFYLSDQVSRVYYFGLNSGDYKEKLKSFEPFRAYIDEASEIDEEKVVFALIRCRQDVYHRYTYEDRIRQKVNTGELKTLEDGLEFFGVTEDDLLTRQKGKNLIKYVANDEGNNWIWNRMVNPYRDKPHPDSNTMRPEQFVDWVHENVGVTEFYITPDESPRIRVGNIVETRDGRTAEVVAVKGKMATLDVGGTTEKHPTTELTLVLERYCMYIFSLENHSLSEDNVENFYFADKATRDQYLHGLTDVKTGKMYPEFGINTHVISQQEIPENWFVWVGIDYNIDIATAVFIAENPYGDLVIFDEFEGFSGNPQTNAFEIMSKLNHPWERTKIYYDNSMDNRDPLHPDRTVAQVYRDAGLKGMRSAIKNRDYGAQKVKEVLQVKHEPGFRPRPTLYVMENCTTNIYGSEHNKGFMNMEWEDWRLKKLDHIDDARRYCISSRANTRPGEFRAASAPRAASHVPTWTRG